MTTVADKSEWVEDAELGVRMREVGESLHVCAFTLDGANRVERAIRAAGWGHSFPDRPAQVFVPHAVFATRIIDPAHRLAFARALSPIECEVHGSAVSQ